MLEKNSEKLRLIQKFNTFLLLCVTMSCVNSVEKDDVEKTTYCISPNDLNCDLHPDFNPELLSDSFTKTESFRINIENSDIRDTHINDKALLPVVNELKQTDDKLEVQLDFCRDQTIRKNNGYVIKYSDARTYGVYAIFFVIIDLNEKESLEFNLLFHKNELVYSSCNARFSLNK